MNREEYISERIRATKRGRKERMEVEYVEVKLPNNVISKTIINGTVKTIKQSKRIVETVPPESEEMGGENGKKFAQRKKNAPIVELRNEKRMIMKLLRLRVPIIYYVIMLFGLANAIIGAFTVISPPVDYSIILGGIGIFSMAFIGVLEIKCAKRKRKIF